MDVREDAMDDRESMKKYYQVSDQNHAATSLPEVFHIARPSGTVQSNSKTIAQSELKHYGIPSSKNTVELKQFTSSVAPKSTFVVQKKVMSNGKLSGFRNKQSFIPANSQSAIILPRPETVDTGKTNLETQIQRIPVLNYTQFQFPHGTQHEIESPSHLKDIKDSNQDDDDKKRNEISGISIDDSSFIENVQNPEVNITLGRNNNGRVRNTSENDERKQKPAKTTEDKQTEHADKRTVDNVRFESTDRAKKEISNDEYIKTDTQPNLIHDHETTVRVEINQRFPPTVTLDTDHLNHNYPKTKESTKTVYGKIDPIFHAVDSKTNLPTTSQRKIKRKAEEQTLDIEHNDTKLKVRMKDNQTADQRSMPDIERFNSVKNKKSYTDNLTDTINRVASGEALLNGITERKINRGRKQGDTITRADPKEEKTQNTVPTELNVKTFQQNRQLAKKNSKTYLDIETRYLGHELTTTTSFQEVFGNQSDVINKIESEKLTKVNDHHLLKLSDKEREFLRNKCYLDNNLTADVRRRFEPQHESKNETNNEKLSPDCQDLVESDKTQPIYYYLNAVDRNGAKDVFDNSRASTSAFCDVNNPRNDKNRFEPQVANVVKESQENVRNKYLNELEVKRRHPVLKLQRLENTLPDKQWDTGIWNDIPDKSKLTTNPSTSKKVYYVINTNDILKLPPQSNGKYASTSKYQISTSESKQLPSLLNSMAHSNVLVSSSSNQPPQSTANIPMTPNSRKTNPVTGQIKLINGSELNGTVSNALKPTVHGEINVKSSWACENLTLPMTWNSQYSNKLTVKELLQAKRQNKRSGFFSNKETKGSKNNPVQLYGRAVNGNQQKAISVVKSKTQTTPTHFELSTVQSNPPDNAVKEAPLPEIHQILDQSKLQPHSGRMIHVLNPTPVLSASTDKQNNNSVPLPSVTAIQKDAELDTVLSVTLPFTETRTGNEMRKQVYIKIGDQTMVVKRCESRNNAMKKTLPAPKPKHSIADDYIRKRRRPKSKHRINYKSLRSKLRKVLQSSNESINLYTLDLIPAQLLKYLVNIKGKQKTHKSDVSNEARAESCQDEIDEKLDNNLTQERNENNISRKRKLSCSNSANMANVMTINKSPTGNVKYSIHQVKIQYTKEKSTSVPNSNILCRLKFSAGGNLEKVYTEILQQGMYLVQNCKSAITYLKHDATLDVLLVLYPPYIVTVPDDSLCIAVGDFYSEEQKHLYQFPRETTDAQRTLDQFLRRNTSTMERMDDFIDKRYCSITDRCMAPRCSSPMFYTPAMKDAFDRHIDGASCCDIHRFDSSVFNLDSRRLETTATNTDVKVIRFSERAMALKVKQNELFETCRKLKSERIAKEGTKRKREKTVLSDSANVGNTKRECVYIERVDGSEISASNICNDESKFCSVSISQELVEHNDSNYDVCVD